MTEQATEEIKQISHSTAEQLEFLRFMSQFYTYSNRNQLLIYSQRKSTLAVLGFTEIKKRGLTLNKGSRAIQILAPCFVKEKNELTGIEEQVLKFFKYVNVFDIAQTNMPPEEYPKLFPNRPIAFKHEFDAETVFHSLVSLAKQVGVTDVVIDDSDQLEGARGGYYIQSKQISLSNGNTPSQNISTLIHEIAHARLHHIKANGFHYSMEIQETQAEMIAYAVSHFLGMDTSEESFPYIAGWSKRLTVFEGKELTHIFDEIQKTAVHFIKMITKEEEEKNEQ